MNSNEDDTGVSRCCSGPRRRKQQDESQQKYQLKIWWGNVWRKDADLRLELRRNGGHRGKVSDAILVWLERTETIQNQMNEIQSQRSKHLLDEVKSHLEDASALLGLSEKNDGAGSAAAAMESKPLVGKLAQQISNEIWEDLMDPTPNIATIGLYGKGGMGKTTIIKNIHTLLVTTEIFDKIIWVTLSESMDLYRVQDDIAGQLGIQLAVDEHEVVRAAILFQHLKKMKKCLFILDDVWNSVLLAKIGIPKPTRGDGCKLVLTTRFWHVCTGMRVDKQIEIVGLSENEAWDLFASRSDVYKIHNSEIQSTAKEIVCQCGGLPIVLIAVGHAMRGKNEADSWREALSEIRSTQTETQEEEEEEEGGTDLLFRLLNFCYSHLSNDRVRKCFLYCALFPEDYKFESRELIGYWMAENLIHNEGDVMASINDGHEILRELKDANMLEMFTEGSHERLKMHDLLRDLAISIVTAEEFFFSVKAGLGLTSLTLMPEYLDGKKISLIGNQIYSLDMDRRCLNLSTLLVRDNPLTHISSSFFKGMPNLQVLDLSYTGIEELPSSLYELPMLRVLLLTYCTSLKEISSLEKLEQMQVLSLRGTLIKELPQGIRNLSSLRSLDLSDTVRLEHIHEGVISSLSNLEELLMQGSFLGTMESAMVANCFKEIRLLENLAILTLSVVGVEDHLETILYLQGQSLKSFSINVYGFTNDYADDV